MGYSRHPGSASNQVGTSLIEVVASTGMMSIVMLALASSMSNAQQAAASVQRRLVFVELQAFLNQALGNTQNCTASLTGQAPPAVGNSVPTLNYAGTLMDDGVNNKFGPIAITNFKYSAVSNIGTVYTATATLEVDLTGGSGPAMVGGNPAPVKLPVTLTVVAGAITQCGASTNVQVAKLVSSCTPASGASFSSCTDTLSWPTPFADTNYSVTCSGVSPTNTALYMDVDTFDAASVTTRTITGAVTTGNFGGGVTCIGVHS